MEWKPIETVKDGAVVIVFDPSAGVFGAAAYKDGSYIDPAYASWDGKGATHWMEYPEPPHPLINQIPI